MSNFKLFALVFVALVVGATSTYFIHTYKITNQLERIDKICNEITLYQYQNNIVINKKLQHMYNNIMEHRKQKHLKYDLFVEIYQMANAHNFDFPLLLAMIDTESNFRKKIMSKKAIGLMQISYPVWKEVFPNMTKAKLKTSKYNMFVGINIYRYYENKYGNNMSDVLFKYNNGETGKYNNTKYAPKVLKLRDKYIEILRM